jgi:hypothetical protein
VARSDPADPALLRAVASIVDQAGGAGGVREAGEGQSGVGGRDVFPSDEAIFAEPYPALRRLAAPVAPPETEPGDLAVAAGGHRRPDRPARRHRPGRDRAGRRPDPARRLAPARA